MWPINYWKRKLLNNLPSFIDIFIVIGCNNLWKIIKNNLCEISSTTLYKIRNIEIASLDSRRDFTQCLCKRQSKFARPSSFLVFVPPTFLTRSSSVLFFFFFLFTRYTLSSSFSASFRNPRQSRRGFANTKTFLRRLKSLDSVALLLVRVSGLKRKTLRLPFSARYRI